MAASANFHRVWPPGPSTLYASAGRLDPGDYTLAWAASSPGEVDLSGRITLPIGDGR